MTAPDPKRAHLRVPALQTPPKFNEKTPRERQEERKWEREREKKSEIWGPHPSGFHLSGPHLGASLNVPTPFPSSSHNFYYDKPPSQDRLFVLFGLVWFGLVWFGWVGFGWLGWVWLGWFGLVWVGLGWVGLGWVGLFWLVGWVGLVVGCWP